jgi:hypothetical protein
MRVHQLMRGVHIAPMPALVKGDVDRKLQGGMPPEGYRARNDWGSALPRMRNDGSSKACQSECFHSTSEWDQAARRGKGAWV